MSADDILIVALVASGALAIVAGAVMISIPAGLIVTGAMQLGCAALIIRHR